MKQSANPGRVGLSPGWRTALLLLPPAVFVVCLCLGRILLSPAEAARSLLSAVGIGESPSNAVNAVVRSLRLPRLILAAVAGAGLSVSGCAFQCLFSNPLATPDTLGVASGASFGAALALLLGAGTLGVQLSALAFGMLAVLMTGAAGRGLGERSTPILAGIMVGSLFSSLVSLVKFAADPESQLPAITFWLMGSMEGAGFRSLLVGTPPILVGMAVLLLLRWRMNLLPLSDDEAVSSGVRLRMLRVTVELCAALITASCVSLCGQVGWVGLLIPHICRMLFGSGSEAILPASVSMGASFLMLVDTAARTLTPKEIPVSILTALLGAPFFLYLLRRNRGWSL